MNYEYTDPRNRQEMSFVEDVAEGMDRMMDEGGGVVDEVLAYRTPVQRNELVDVGQYEQDVVEYGQDE
ncbi:hypothetical protein [Aneurinibacillus aneurinilyticus]|jgi:hypothetical protein|uniref:Uncharacterized protein n=2 Tax=Aneurinibacillus aneurinilyticus TaxID=1391 RepID=A0A848CZC5_ANEAE|nr:hypothetical protein [Aneurinibacillus aneurinilyticus]ERI10606.1 hypothetical protein HMPREF0083_01309 [Aneurinibacillus aneurinilyticus ATCC 12856]MCI1696238.1 hypothetical protein [Aneurinibacillus aneurinilyticus]MED0672158.1 hypothetical protein [Aneurinibacillus aneurinilyticus]MED0706806.1 hypothetical protein [Aneurinibacillus aneurinilyticus]MED0723804.1 hypothetical protein [Aneurinibacillus aneurinilyticus]